jgi:hypothetical protein
MADVTIRFGDRLPVLARQFLTDSVATDLTGATVTFSMWNATSGAQVITNAACTIDNALTGSVSYAWSSGDSALPAAIYLASFTATFSSARKLTAPNGSMLIVEITGQTGATWSYTGNPATRAIDAVRFLSGDTDSSNALVGDYEITFLLTEWNNDTYLAAAAVCEAGAGKAASKSDQSKSVGDLSISTQYAGQAKSFTDRAASLRLQAARKSPPLPTYDSSAVGTFEFSVGMDRFTASTGYTTTSVT